MSETLKTILQWLKEGKITPEEAESLLETLEKERAEKPRHHRLICLCCCPPHERESEAVEMASCCG